jgi:agmatine deiminase
MESNEQRVKPARRIRLKRWWSLLYEMKIYITLLILILLFSCNREPEKRLYAEWEPTEYIWIQWDTDSYLSKEAMELSLIELLSSITPYHKVRIFVDDPELRENAEHLIREYKVDNRQIEFMNAHGGGAITDPSPIFLNVGNGKFATVDFRWNNYGVREVGHPRTLDTDTFDIEVARKLNLDVIAKSELVWEGGAMDHNGKGTIVFAEQWMFQRNPGWTKDQIEKELSKKLGIRKIIWLKNGPSEDDFKRILPGDVYPFGTGGHVDEFCRFVNDSTILLASLTQTDRKIGGIENETYQRMEENFSILQHEVDQDGKSFKIIRVPTPNLIIKRIASSEINPWDAAWFPGYEQKDSINFVLASSYLNFVLTDKMVIAAKYWKPGRPESMKSKDSIVKDLFEQLFPNKEIIQLNPEAFNHQGGGFHCYTYNEPVRN